VKCSYCGAELNPDEKFCGSCGAKVGFEKSTTNPLNKPISAGKRKKSKKVIAFIVAIAIILAGIPTGWFVWNKVSHKDMNLSVSDSTYVEIDKKYTDKKIT
jgi:uncharacterized membrane protein YvbJ